MNSGGACGWLTVITGSGADIWCTFHIDTDATPSAIAATNGIRLGLGPFCQPNVDSPNHLPRPHHTTDVN